MSMAASPLFSDAVVVMGVASCGKTTIGEALAKRLGVPFTEGDKLHSSESVAKMSAGIALTDADRWPWLARVGEALQGSAGHIVSCSALRKSYREAIAKAAKRPVKFVHLHGSQQVLSQRISSRKGHFMPATLLSSQLATLEMPTPDEQAVTIDIEQTIEAILKSALQFLQQEKA
jgi:gluconokinase